MFPDPNVCSFISSLLFKGGLAGMVDLWKEVKIIPVISRETFDEFRQVLAYPKFGLTKGEIKFVIEEEVLPFFEVVEVNARVKGVCADPDDDKFISCALAAKADLIVSGDKDLCDLRKYGTIRIVKAVDFLRMLE